MACVRWESVAGEAEVACRITGLGVRVGQGVAKGQLLFQFDPNPYALTVAQAKAAINSARFDVGNLSAGLATTQVDIAKAKEDIAFAEVNFQRQAALMDKGFTTRAAYDASRHAVEQARASLAQAQADAAEARAKLATGGGDTNPQVPAARSEERRVGKGCVRKGRARWEP